LIGTALGGPSHGFALPLKGVRTTPRARGRLNAYAKENKCTRDHAAREGEAARQQATI